MAMSHMQKHGHRPIALMGGGTGMVGDPTDRTEMRRVMGENEISSNVANFKKQFSKFIDFEGDNYRRDAYGTFLLKYRLLSK
jgi:tyrosyl-tRNA synthetase